MEKYPEQPQFNEGVEKPKDWLPDGSDDKEHRLAVDAEWHELEKRLGQPRILNHIYFTEIFDWIKKEYKNNPDAFSYFEAGCGHGNDLRAIRKELGETGERGRFLGVDMSAVEIMHGMEFYRQQDNEEIEESRKLFAQGDLRNMANINIWNETRGDFSQPARIKDGEFDLIYIEAVLHTFGYGKKTYQEKKESVKQMLNELYRICKAGGKFFGRTAAFDSTVTEEDQFERLRKTNNWRFVPRAGEFEEMLQQAGFTDVKITQNPHERAESDPNKKNILRFSFLAQK